MPASQQMGSTMNEQAKGVPALTMFRRDLASMEKQFMAALPEHIPPQRFMRVILTAVQTNSKLLQCTRQSLFAAAMRAAQDGLMPDGREGAIVPFGDEEDGRRKSDQAQWMPMVAGLRKKCRNSGEVSDWQVELVYEGDYFKFRKGDDPKIEHEPSLVGGRTRKILAVYSIAWLRDQTISRHVMGIDEVEQIRHRFSRAKRGPWHDAITYGEMVKKTCARAHSKTLPMSTDLDDLLRRDDRLFGGGLDREAGHVALPDRRATPLVGVRASLDEFGGDEGLEDQPGGETLDNDPSPPAAIERPQVEVRPAPDNVTRLLALAERNPPMSADIFRSLVTSLIYAAREVGPLGAQQLSTWWSGDTARKLRNRAGLTADDTAELTGEIEGACNTIGGKA